MNQFMYNAYDVMNYIRHPLRKTAQTVRSYLRGHPAFLGFGSARFIEGLSDMYERSTRESQKPEFNIDTVDVDGQSVKAYQTTVLKKPFCNLIRFLSAGLHAHQKQRIDNAARRRADPDVCSISKYANHSIAQKFLHAVRAFQRFLRLLPAPV